MARVVRLAPADCSSKSGARFAQANLTIIDLRNFGGIDDVVLAVSDDSVGRAPGRRRP